MMNAGTSVLNHGDLINTLKWWGTRLE